MSCLKSSSFMLNVWTQATYRLGFFFQHYLRFIFCKGNVWFDTDCVAELRWHWPEIWGRNDRYQSDRLIVYWWSCKKRRVSCCCNADRSVHFVFTVLVANRKKIISNYLYFYILMKKVVFYCKRLCYFSYYYFTDCFNSTVAGLCHVIYVMNL